MQMGLTVSPFRGPNGPLDYILRETGACLHGGLSNFVHSFLETWVPLRGVIFEHGDVPESPGGS